MIKTRWDLDKLRELEKLTAPARRKKGWPRWKASATTRYRKRLLTALEKYKELVVDLIKKHIPEYDREKYTINVQKIYISKEADSILYNILLDGDYLNISLSTKPELEPDEVWIDEKEVLTPKQTT